MESRQSSVRAADEPGPLRLSALMDGEADAADCSALLDAWRHDDELRADWHLYHLIGDVLRSEDLAQAPGHDAGLLAAVRQRLAAEPVILAPAPMAAPVSAPPVRWASGRWLAGTRLRHWNAPAAVAAGMLSVAGVAVLLRGPAQIEPAAPVVASVASAPTAPSGGALTLASQDVSGAALVRDPELDRYLEAHRQHGRGMALATPDGIRQVVSQSAGQ